LTIIEQRFSLNVLRLSQQEVLPWQENDEKASGCSRSIHGENTKC